MKRLAGIIAFASAIGCSESPAPVGPTGTTPQVEIADGSHGGSAHFYFLPPMVAPTAYTGAFDPDVEPVVEICRLSGADCDAVIATFTMTGGPGSERIRVSAVKGNYQVSWHTRQFDLDLTAIYRIRVLVGTRVLGYADVTLAPATEVNPDEFIAIVYGQTLPIKFRIETGFPSTLTVSPSSSDVAEGSTEAFTATVYDLHGVAMTCAQAIAWSSSNNVVATVASTGVATGVAPGTVTVTAACEGAQGTASLLVTPAPVTWAAQTSGTTEHLEDISGTSATDIFIAGQTGGILYNAGAGWSPMTNPTTWYGFGIWAISPSDVFIVGTRFGILHYDGSAWGTMSSPILTETFAVWGASANDVWAGGEYGRMAHYDGTTWTLATPQNFRVHGIWGTSGSNVYAVTQPGRILNYNGSSWSIVYTNTLWAFRDVWGSSPTDIFVVGPNGRILHFDGTSWTTMSSGTTASLNDVWGFGPDDVYAVGSGGTILHYNGVAWSAVSSGTTEGLSAVWGSSTSDVYAVGRNGTILHGTK